MSVKLPITKVNNLDEARALVGALYDLGYAVYHNNERIDKDKDKGWEKCLEKDDRITHIWLYNTYGYNYSIWTCGRNRRFSNTLNSSLYNLTLVNSPSHLLSYIKNKGLHPIKAPAYDL